MVNLQPTNLDPQRDKGSGQSTSATGQSDTPVAQICFDSILEAIHPLSVVDESFEEALMGLRERLNTGELK